MRYFYLDLILDYLKTSIHDGCDTTADVFIFCSNGVVQTHRLVLASISNMLMSIFKQESWDESISLMLVDFTAEQISEYLSEFFEYGSKIHDNSLVGNALGVQEKLHLKKEQKEFLSVTDQNSFDILNSNQNIKSENFEFENEYLSVDFKEDVITEENNFSSEENIKEVNIKRPSYTNREKECSGREESLTIYLSNETMKYFDIDKEVEKECVCKICSLKLSYSKVMMKKHLMDDHLETFQTLKNEYYKGQIPSRKPSASRQYFDFNEENPADAYCKLCGKHLSDFRVSDLSQHIRINHPEIYKTLNIRKFGGAHSVGQKKYSQYYSEKPETPNKVTCLLCNSDITYGNITKHIKKMHKIYEDGTVPQVFPCSICGREFADKWNRDSHEKTVHREKSRFSCNVCGKEFPEKHNYVEHMYNKHPLEKLDEDIDTDMCSSNVCSFCGKQFATERRLKYHNCEAKGGDFKCDKCEVVFYSLYQLKLHAKVCDEFEHCRVAIRTLTCTACNIKFESYKKFIVHCNNSASCTLLGNKAFNCDECNKRFRTKEQLEKHSRVHTGDTPYLCEFCLKKFKFLHRLHNHQCLQ